MARSATSLKCMKHRAHMRDCEMPNCGSTNMLGGKVQLKGKITTQLNWQEMWAGVWRE